MQQKSFAFFLFLSSAFHIAGGAFFILKSHNFNSQKTIVSTVQVNFQTPKALTQAAAPAAVTAKNKVLNLKKNIKKPLQRKPKKPSPSAKSKKQHPKKRKKPKTDLKNKDPGAPSEISASKPQPAEKEDAAPKNQKTKGHDGGPALASIEKAQFRAYIFHIKEKIQAVWNIPKHLAESNLQTLVEVKILKTGALTEKKITVSSQNPLFDQLVLKALEKSAPFPPMPQELEQLNPDGIFVFRLNSNEE